MSTMSNFNINVSLPEGVFPPTAIDLINDRQGSLNEMAAFFIACAGGMEPGSVGETRIVLQKGSTAAQAVRAFGTITFTTASGTVGAVVAGVTLTFAHTTDAGDATALVAAIVANATVNALVEAVAVSTVVTITAKVPGVIGNQITLAASGTGSAAGNVASGKILSGVGGDGPTATLSF